MIERHQWNVFNHDNSGLPHDGVRALAVGEGGALWVGTVSGLARFAVGAWEVYTAANSDLPHDGVTALAVGEGGALWVGTWGGLARFNWQRVQPRIEQIPAPTTIRQRENTFAVWGFDPTYRSGTEHFRYEWSVEKRGVFGSEPVSEPFKTRSAFFSAAFPEDGAYVVRAVAIDRYGRRSEPTEFRVGVETPAPEPWWMDWARWVGAAFGGTAALYLIALWPLLLLYSRTNWARSAVNSGAFSHAPILHKHLLSSRWARRRLFARYAEQAAGLEELANYISQAVSPAGGGEPLPLARVENPLGELRARARYLLILGRSGTGKSVLLQRLHRLDAARFRVGQAGSLPVLLNAPTHLGQKGDVADALKDALRREGRVELPDDALDFLIRKGGFLILVDALNELPGAGDALRAFLNRDANNVVLMVSQTDVLRRQDVAVFTMVEVSEEQAAEYLAAAVGSGVWDALPPGLRSLTRNPQDLVFIAEVAGGDLPLSELPTRRADLYAKKLEKDSALREWVAIADPRLGVMYALAFRMLAERRVLDEPTLAEWVREALAMRDLNTGEVDTVVAAVRRSRLFREDAALDRLGRRQPVLAFDHELIGAFLAARHVRSALTGPERAKMLALAEPETWQNVFFFVVDELSAAMLPGALLDDLLARGGDAPLRIVAYAIESKKDEDPPLPGRIQAAYATAKLRQDVQLTPAA